MLLSQIFHREFRSFFVRLDDSQLPVHYEPRVLGIAKGHFVDTKNKIDLWEDMCFAFPAEEDGQSVDWEKGKNIVPLKDKLVKEGISGSSFGEIPIGLTQEKNYVQFAKGIAAFIYQNQTYQIYQTTDPKMTSKEGESEKDFRIRVAHEMREQRDERVAKLRETYAAKMDGIKLKLERSQEKVAQNQRKSWGRIFQTILSFGMAILGLFFGKKITQKTISQTGSSLRRAGQITKDSQETSQQEASVLSYQQQIQEIERQMNGEIAALASHLDAENLVIETIRIRPRKSDTSVEKVALVWWPVMG